MRLYQPRRIPLDSRHNRNTGCRDSLHASLQSWHDKSPSNFSAVQKARDACNASLPAKKNPADSRHNRHTGCRDALHASPRSCHGKSPSNFVAVQKARDACNASLPAKKNPADSRHNRHTRCRDALHASLRSCHGKSLSNFSAVQKQETHAMRLYQPRRIPPTLDITGTRDVETHCMRLYSPGTTNLYQIFRLCKSKRRMQCVSTSQEESRRLSA